MTATSPATSDSLDDINDDVARALGASVAGQSID